MDSSQNKDWKKSVGFPINYSSHSSDEDFDNSEVVMRHPWQSSRYLLEDGGDGAEADILGTTPPRARIRDKEKRRNVLDTQTGAQRVLRIKKTEDMLRAEQASIAERRKKGVSLKLRRKEARDYKQDQSQGQSKADSLPSPGPQPAVPTLVESCSRFMSLTSRLKCPQECKEEAAEERAREGGAGDGELPENRVNFHRTFCLLINMGNTDKGCRRTISREEQVWQNELKDLIWLELQAKIAGRSLAEQDEFLCTQRNIVPTLVRNIIDYRFVSSHVCRSRSRRLCAIQGSKEDLSGDHDDGQPSGNNFADDSSAVGCLSFNCEPCTAAVGKAMRELGTLLDSFYNAVLLYPSSKAMTVDHPLVATQLFKNRIKAMCLWYNTALHMRMKMRGMKCMLQSMRTKSQRRGLHHRASTDSDTSRRSSECHKPSQVRFNICGNPTDSSNSESSLHSDVIKEEGEVPSQQQKTDQKENYGEANGLKEGQSDGGEQERGGEDEVDYRLRDQNGHITPEIVISDRYGTSDSTSTESGYLSAGESEHGEHVYDVGSLAEITQLRLLDKCAVSAYRDYHYEMLKTQGVRRCMTFINKIRKNILGKVYMTLQKSDSVEADVSGPGDATQVFEDTREEEEGRENAGDEEALVNELKRYGCWSEECLAMRLPSYRNHFLLLSSICMEAMHDYLTLRLEGRPEHPSCLTVKQLIHELKEGLDIATEIRADFVKHVVAALAERPAAAEAQRDLRTLIATYDDTVETVLKQYLSYLMTMSETEQMSRACLQSEWQFTARLAKRVKCASQLAPDAFSKIACNQMNRVMNQFQAKANNIKHMMDDIENKTEYIRELVYMICRETQALYASEREAVLQSVQWARALAAKLARAPPPAFTTQRQQIFEKLMAIRELIVQHTKIVLEKSQVPEEEMPKDYVEGLAMRVRELLLQMFKLGFELHRELCKLSPGTAEPEARQKRPSSLQLPRAQPAVGARRPRPETVLIHESLNSPTIHKELHRFGTSSSCRPGLVSSRRSLLNSPPKFSRSKFTRSESINEDENSVLDDRLFENFTADNHVHNSIELLLSGEEPASEEVVEFRKSSGGSRVSGEQRRWEAVVARAVIQFARYWMQFVVERCDRGRGLRPRWASQGLDFLMLACDPCNTKYLSEEEFKELEAQMDGCISHVVGSRRATPKPDLAPSSPRPTRGRTRLHTPATATCLGVPPPPTPPVEPDPLLCFRGIEYAGHSKRVMEAIARLEVSREDSLRSKQTVGRVLGAAVHSYEPKLKQVTFKWQRGLKIGAGTFGKVYTVVNTESGQLLAMKELSVGAGDRRALQRAANELRVLEGIVHPHLVRYYGIELHREEMLLFMELCVEGSLETLIVGAGALPELTVRRYTKQLLSAVAELHVRGVAHRDIKSGNIFLTNEGHCLKLGDFGCAVKIRANTTAPGELQGFVGTQAYMAPEVFMKGGHGRAADVWSLGCVVIEMASGKRPFAEYDSNYQIMFVVGMGGRPDIPGTLSEEGQQFCCACLTHDPDQRPRAEQLVLHHFLMIKSDEDCKCEPAFLLS